MSPTPKQPLRSTNAEEDPFRVDVRTRFFAAVNHVTDGAATERLQEALQLFEELAASLEDTNVFPPWRLSELREIPRATGQGESIWHESWDDPPDDDGEPDPVNFPAKWEEDVKAGISEALSPETERWPESAEALEKAIEAWAKPYQLHRDRWVVDHVCLNFQTHREYGYSEPFTLGAPIPIPGAPGMLVAAVPFAAYKAPSSPAIKIPLKTPVPRTHTQGTASWLRPYNPAKETASEFLVRWNKVGEEYTSAVDELYRSRGWEPAPWKPHLDLHLRWLARHQCLGLPVEKSGKVEESNIRRAIQRLAQLLPLTLRPAPNRPQIN